MSSAPTYEPTVLPGGEPTLAPDTRVSSVDTLRGLVILLMIFVNDLAGAERGVPHWLTHAQSNADEMTVPDLVFPGFLFIAGVSIPLAIWHARRRGAGNLAILGKIAVRTLGLLVMGVMMVNQEGHDITYHWFEKTPAAAAAPSNPATPGLAPLSTTATQAAVAPPAENRRSNARPHYLINIKWGLLAYIAMLMAFPVIPRAPEKKRRIFMGIKTVGWIALITVALLYTDRRGNHIVFGPLFSATDHTWLRHSWWGILGLIGWAYFTTSMIYLAVGRRREWLIGAAMTLMMFYVATREDGGLFARVDRRVWLDHYRFLLNGLRSVYEWVDGNIGWGEVLGTGAAITMSGCCLGSILIPSSDVRSHGERIRWGLMFATVLFVAGLMLDPPYGISKNNATPSWSFYCASFTTVVWVILYWLMDVRGWKKWSLIVAPAGAIPLLAYLLHPLVTELMPFAFSFHSDEWPTIFNIIGSLAMAFLIVGLTGLIGRLGYRMRA